MGTKVSKLSGTAGTFTSTAVSHRTGDSPVIGGRVDVWRFLGWIETFETTGFGDGGNYDEEIGIAHGDVTLIVTLVNNIVPGFGNLGTDCAIKLYLSGSGKANLRLEGTVAFSRMPIEWGDQEQDGDKFMFTELFGRFKGAITEALG